MKSHVSGHSKSTPPTVFNLQASDLVHYAEETGAFYQLSRNIYKLIKKITNFKVIYFDKKKFISKNSVKFIIIFF